MNRLTEFFNENIKKQGRVWPLVLVRLLVGYLYIKSGLVWLGYDDPSGEMISEISKTLENGTAFSFYEPFLRGFVLNNAALFTFLVSWGEFLVGVSVFTGTMTRVGCGAGIFMMLNYILRKASTLARPVIGPPLWLLLLAVIFLTSAGRVFGVDHYLYKKWPKIKLW